MNEIWRDIIGYDGKYQISNKGRVKSLVGNEKILKNGKASIKNGRLIYPKVNLHKDGKIKYSAIHRLVAIHFIDNPYDKPQVNHKNKIISDYSIENLEWVTSLENIQHKMTYVKKEYGDKFSKYIEGLIPIK